MLSRTFTRHLSKQVKSSNFGKSSTKTSGPSSSTTAPLVPIDVKDVLAKTKAKTTEALERLQGKLEGIRGGGGMDAAMIERVALEDGSEIKDVATVSSANPSKLVVALADPAMLAAVEKAIGLAVNMPVKGSKDGVIEVMVPKSTKEQREAKAKAVAEEAEKVKIQLRAVRKEAQGRFKGLPADEFKRAEKQLETVVDQAIEKVTQVIEKKRKELLGA